MKNKLFILSLIILILLSSVVYLYSNDLGSSFGIVSPWKKSSTNVSTAVSTDNVGVGEDAPETDIEITSTAPYITLHNSTNEKTDGGMESRIRAKGEDPNGVEWHLGTIKFSHDGTSADGKADIIFSNNDGNDTDDNLQERMRIDSSGNVGIANTAPEYKLDVTTGARTGFRLSNTGGASNNTDLVMTAGSTGSTGEASVIFGDADDISMGWVTYDNSNNSLRFGTSNTQDRVVIDSSGNFGIGTTSPDALLHAEKSTALTNTQQEVIRISATTTGIPAAGFGAGMGFELETDANSAGHMEVVGFVYGEIEDPTLNSEDGAVIIKTMTGGAAATEKMRINSSGGMVLQGSFNYGVDAEATDAYVVDLDPNLSAYVDGFIVYWNPNNPNTGACTLRLTGGLAIKNIKTQGGDDPPDNYIEAGTTSRPGAMFNSTADCWVLITPDANP